METKIYYAAAHALREKLSKEINEECKYDKRLNDSLDLVSAAAATSSTSAIAAAAASFGGVLRSMRSEVRIEAADKIMKLLEIIATVHIARAVMKKAFRTAVGGDALVGSFADPGRSAANKIMPEAMRKLDTPEGDAACTAFSDVYFWFCKDALPERVNHIKKQRADERRDKTKRVDDSVPE